MPWVTDWDAAHYGATFAGVGCDPRDPPRFESQPAYLARHDLLSPAERGRLGAVDFQPETLGRRAEWCASAPAYTVQWSQSP